MISALFVSLALVAGISTPRPADGPTPPAPLAASEQAAPETIVEFRVHGNNLTPDDEVVKLAGVALGSPFGPTTISDIHARLRASKKFQEVTVLKRYASIADGSKIVIVIIVDEGPLRIELPGLSTGPVRVVKRQGFHNLMFMPILDAEDGYGFTYGVRLAMVRRAGKDGRFSFPLTWGGLKRAGAEYDRNFARGPFTRVILGGAVQRQKNPAFELNDDRNRVWARAERAHRWVRAGGTVGWQRVTFDGAHERIRSIGGDVAFDTRIEPLLPRNAVYAIASWERLNFGSGGATNRIRVEGNGYIGLVGQTVLALRAVREDASQPLPPYLKSLLGGWSSLRGFKAGSYVGDTLVTASAELRIPLTSPVSFGKVGVSIFVDTGAAYDKGKRFRDQTLQRGVGASAWMTAAVFRMSLSVAHGIGASTRVNFGLGLTF